MITSFPLWATLGLFALAATVVLFFGLRMTALADRIADRTGLGEAVIGGVLLGASTSLSGSIVSLTAALDGHASLAFSNGIGGIAAQTAFLALADLIYRHANLEHASADLANMFQSALLMLMLAVPLIAYWTPAVTFWSIHPASAILVLLYVAGLRGTAQLRRRPMWTPTHTQETRYDAPEDPAEPTRSPTRLFLTFLVMAVFLSAAGWTIAQCGEVIVAKLGISASVVGALLTATATSLPELVTTIAAVRRGALQLAVGGIIGGNTFDVLFLTLSDIGYRGGSLYHAIGERDFFWLAVGMAMTACLLLGLILRERRGIAGIGFESVGVLCMYAAAVVVQAVQG